MLSVLSYLVVYIKQLVPVWPGNLDHPDLCSFFLFEYVYTRNMSMTPNLSLPETKTTSRWWSLFQDSMGNRNTGKPYQQQSQQNDIHRLTKRNSAKGLRVLGNCQYLPEHHFSLCGVWPVFWLLELQEFLFPMSCLCWPVFQAIMLQNLKFCCNKHQILMEKQWKLWRD